MAHKSIYLIGGIVAGAVVGFAATSLVFADNQVPSTLLGAYYGACISGEQATAGNMLTADQLADLFAGVDAKQGEFGLFRGRALEIAGVLEFSQDTCPDIKNAIEPDVS